ncbi:hypothetical protein CYY_010218 [Polysphondylium violaceum]|uniref:Short-chain dehydrogenase/reductase family protein n=1 Tax=Polysphondylium violaceum TaxID=133409 RepID=A0A8J4PJF5_9MYCE|nr:hypothetical protein CYY_010218 [Polysphondylium violaceum]
MDKQEQQQKLQNQVWFLTGCTSGTGLALVEELLSLGVKVAGTSRNLKKLKELSISRNCNFLGLQVDLVDEKSVQNSIDKTIKHFGSITHVVNNAGFGIFGSVEEVSDEESRKLFDVLYFGVVNVVRAILPYYRSRKEGYIFNVSSASGFRGVRSFGHYNAAKFAVTGMTEALSLDVKEFNIKVSNIILGFFRTGFEDKLEQCKNPIAEYQTMEIYLPKRNLLFKTIQLGDPYKYAQVLIEHSFLLELPCNLFIGPPASFEICEKKVKQLDQQIQSQKERNSNVTIE